MKILVTGARGFVGRNLVENLKNYDGKTVSFLGQTGFNSRIPKGGCVIGRPIMTCCAEDTPHNP